MVLAQQLNSMYMAPSGDNIPHERSKDITTKNSKATRRKSTLAGSMPKILEGVHCSLINR